MRGWSPTERRPSLAWAAVLALSACACLVQGQATKADSGWVPLFNGTDFRGLYTYFAGPGYTPTSVDTQHVFTVKDGMVRVVPPARNGYLGTIRQYSWYRVRVDYMWPAGTPLTTNAGLLIHLDSAAVFSRKIVADNRPRSIEVNMRRQEASPWTLWSASGLGPYFTTTVQPGTTNSYQAGGTLWTNDPWGGDLRTLYSSLPNPELPVGQWNHGEAHVFGDSGVFILNGQVRTRAWNFQLRANAGSANPRVGCCSGNIGLQSEGAEIWYRNFEIMELDSATGKPLHGHWGCTNPSAPNYDPAAKVDDGSCGPVALGPRPGRAPSPERPLRAGGRKMHYRKAGKPSGEWFNAQGQRDR
jgi:hypothetical protein